MPPATLSPPVGSGHQECSQPAHPRSPPPVTAECRVRARTRVTSGPNESTGKLKGVLSVPLARGPRPSHALPLPRRAPDARGTRKLVAVPTTSPTTPPSDRPLRKDQAPLGNTCVRATPGQFAFLLAAALHPVLKARLRPRGLDIRGSAPADRPHGSAIALRNSSFVYTEYEREKERERERSLNPADLYGRRSRSAPFHKAVTKAPECLYHGRVSREVRSPGCRGPYAPTQLTSSSRIIRLRTEPTILLLIFFFFFFFYCHLLPRPVVAIPYPNTNFARYACPYPPPTSPPPPAATSITRDTSYPLIALDARSHKYARQSQ
jgi:hypothetical protein